MSDSSAEEIRHVLEAEAAPDEAFHSAWFAVSSAMAEAAVWTTDAPGKQCKEGRR